MTNDEYFVLDSLPKVSGSANLTNPNCSDSLLDSNLVKTIKTVAYLVLLVVTLVGNTLVVAVTYRNPKLRRSINLFILNMAISDLLLPLFALPITIKRIYLPQEVWLADGPFGVITCKFAPFATDLSLIVSIFTLELIALERFSSIVMPLLKKDGTKKKSCYIVIALTWIIGGIYPSLNFYKYKLIHKDATTYCVRRWEPAFNSAEVFKVEGPVLLVCFTMLPFLLLTGLYSTIIISLHRQKKHLHLASNERKRREKENRQVTYMLMTVVAVFLLSWLLFNVYWLLRAYVWNFQQWCDSRHLTFSAIFFMNTYPAVNPFVYYIFNQNYRKGFRELLCCCKQCSLFRIRRNSRATETGSSQVVVLLSKRSLDT